MSPKIAFALLLLGCALLGLANADRWNNQRTRGSPYQTRKIPVAPESQGNECNCPCGEAEQGGSLNGGNPNYPTIGYLGGAGGAGGAGGDGGQGGAGGQGGMGANGGTNVIAAFEKDVKPGGNINRRKHL